MTHSRNRAGKGAPGALAAVALTALLALADAPSPASAQAAQNQQVGSASCAIITQAAADAVAGRIQADDQTIKDPISVKNLTCLDGFFNGFGLNLLTNLLDPSTLLANVEGKICSMVKQTLSSLTGSAQCGLTLTGFDFSFGTGIGGGSFCPKLSFGGGGPSWGTLGVGTGGSGGFTVNGAGIPPTGYPLLPSSGSF